ncbi:ATP-binding protein [Flavobacterium rakeshii]|uniref:HD domain-containing protein n=1 Tax=Flavobacterium rakeshii TaxID=1038845 RepID=UPI002E7B87A8|nr:ATP-binding protein [Flavobacterium rakeshii]MEE1899666.1 ATP-binding protein [Flavobacterium rakeshii]
MSLTTKAEKLAEKAENLKAFSGLKLLHIKKQVEKILNQIGRDGIFDEYTKHDISHINYMLKSLDWIIPKETQNKLTSSDWLIIVLSIYLHDLGMLVTKDEFNNREKSAFPSFKNDILEGIYGLDYKEKILSIESTDRQDRFIYQELVRKTHAERIKFWILDEADPNFSADLQIIKEIKDLLASLDNMFRRDLATICESHHLNDLEDLDKYKVNQQYGPSSDEVVNLQYAALILRTADLLHITSDRTPSIEFNLINPTDPISQDEWAKQASVKAIRPKDKRDKDGNIDLNIAKDTFEVIALFENEKGFFGLISYLNYADKQLKENFRFNELAKKSYSTDYEYPWKNIDDSSIEAKNFEKKQLEFVLDQTKILDLLVGHTLYNDPTVVLRELTQNAIDASKLKSHELSLQGKKSTYTPQIKIVWEEKKRELSFIDNGTGMTLDIIQNHLLKVGSSRYQDSNFKKKYPDFSPISRFGIGLLTCFLIADDIDILTKSSETDKAILLKIRKVHGKYLLKYIPANKIPSEIASHGTKIKLSVRSDVKLNNIDDELKKWILIPNCELTLENNGTLTNIGYKTTKEALETHLTENGYVVDNKNIKVVEIQKEGLTIAYALRFLDHWNEWVFLEATYLDMEKSPVGTYIEGIKVDFNTPGFNSINIYSIVNTTGKNAPKTNVARSTIEITPEKEHLLYKIYELYLIHITEELNNLKKAGFSVTWAVNEIYYILYTFMSNSSYRGHETKLENQNLFEKALSNIDCILIEQKGERKLTSINNLKELNHFWTIDCASYRSANSLIKEVKASNSSAITLLKSIFNTDDPITTHIDILLCNTKTESQIDNVINRNFQISSIKVIPEQRRLDLKWTHTHDKIWEEISLEEDDTRVNKCYIQLKDIETINIKEEIAITTSNNMYILKNSNINNYIIDLNKKLSNTREDRIALSKIVGIISSLFYFKDINESDIEMIIDNLLERNKNRNINKSLWEKVDKKELIETILKSNFVKFDTTIWNRRLVY